MARLKDPNMENRPQVHKTLQLILWILAFFVGIGDIVRFLFRLIYLIPFKAYNLISSVLHNGYAAGTHWIHEKFTRAMKPKLPPGRPRKKTSLLLRWNTWIHTLQQATRISRSTLGILLRAWQKRRLLRQQRAFRKKEKQKQLAIVRPHKIHIPTGLLPKFRLPSIQFPIFSRSKIIFQKAQDSKFRTSKIELLKSFITGIAVTILFIFVPYMTYQWLTALPNPQLLSRRDLQVTTKIFDRHSALLFEIYADQNRTPLSLSEIPSFITNATISIEDRDFYRH